MSNYRKSKSEQFLEKRGAIPPVGSGLIESNIAHTSAHMSQGVPQVSALMAKSVSAFRREALTEEVKQGLFKDGTGPTFNEDGMTSNAVVTSLVGITKNAQVVSGGSSAGSSNYRGGNGDVVKQTPEVYSPLWLNSNLNLPRDRPTINAWCRSFYALNPFVHNAINLHSTYPISKLNIKCPNKDIEKFFNDMIEEIDLMNICVQIAQEFWLLGEAFVYAELDESKGKWSRLVIQNPDYMLVKRTVVANEPIIMLRPDENLKKIVFSNKPSDIEQRKQLNQHIIDSVKHGENIPLDNFHVSHLARRISPYEIRGTGLPVCIFRQLMLFDKLRESKYAQADNMINPLTLVKIGSADFKPTFADLEAWRNVFECYDEETEVLTDSGFKKFYEVINYTEKLDKISPKENVKIACFNSNNEQLEYHYATGASVYNYNGNMFHFKNEKLDIKVTPNHKMWTSEKIDDYNDNRSLKKSIWSDWKKIEAKDLNLNNYNKFRSKINWQGNDNVIFIDVCGKQIPVELYLELLGYLLNEGRLYINDKHQYTVGISQTTNKNYNKMRQCLDSFSKCINIPYIQRIEKRSEYTNNQQYIWSAVFYSKELYDYFENIIGDMNVETKAQFKQIPRNVLDFSPRLLNILLNALIDGSGSVYKNNKKDSDRFAYCSTSKQLADDIYEIAYKCGYVPSMSIRNNKKHLNGRRLPLYTVLWSNSNKWNYPLVYKTPRNSKTKIKQNIVKIEKYNGKVWCFEVPTGLFITRRNGKITIQGNSAQYDKDFKIFTHEGVTVEKVGYNQGIYDISNDITQIIKEIYVGLQVPSVLMDGGADTTYANGGVALDVLRQRYMQFRNMMSIWLKRKIFAPISKIQGFYDYSNGEKQLIVPDVDWNHMSLFDAGDYINNLVTLTQGDGAQKRVSLHTLFRSMGLEYENELRKMRREIVDAEIFEKEKAALKEMPLNALRALDEEDEIPEAKNQQEGATSASEGTPLPGETSSGGGLPGLEGLPNTPPPPPMPGGGGEGSGGAPPTL